MTYPQTTSTAYQDARRAAIGAENAFRDAAVSEIQRLMPDGVIALIFALNDTPRLAFEAFLVEGDADGEEREAEEIDDFAGQPYLYDNLDSIAMELGFRDFEDADNELMRLNPDSDEARWFVGLDGANIS